MEPLSLIATIAAVSKAVYGVSAVLYSFIQDTRNVDESLKSFIAEVDTFKQAVAAIGVAIQGPTLQTYTATIEDDAALELWKSVESSLIESRKTLDDLEHHLDEIRGHKVTRNPFRRPLKQIKLNLKADVIVLRRAQIGTHTRAMQLALQVINVYISCKGPETVIDRLDPKLDVLIEMVAQFDPFSFTHVLPQVPQEAISSNSPNQNRLFYHDSSMLASAERLRQIAKRVASNASSISSSGSTVRGGSEIYFRESDPPVQGSVLGEPLSMHQLHQISTWNLQIDAQEIIQDRPAPESSVSGFRDGARGSSSQSTTAMISRRLGNKDVADMSDSEEDITYEVFQTLVKEGEQKLQQGKLQEAERFFRSAFREAGTLSLERVQSGDVGGIKLKLAQACLKQKKFEEAKSLLESLITAYNAVTPGINISAVHVTQALHVLAEVLLALGELTEAETRCKRAMLARRRILGKDHEEYHESVLLMVSICEAKGDAELAKGYKALLPAAKATATNATPGSFSSQQLENPLSTTTPFEPIAETGNPLRGHSGQVRAVTFAPDGRQLASASDDQTVRLWDAATGAALKTLEGHSHCVYAVAFTPDGKWLASASGDQTVRVWDTATGAALKTLKGHSGAVYKVAFAPTGKHLASASMDQTVRLWDMETGAALRTFRGHSNYVYTVTFTPDGKWLASASGDQTVRVWDTATGAALKTLKGHSGPVWGVGFRPDGMELASASVDQTVRLWDAATGATLKTLKGHSGGVWAVTFTPDGKRLASASKDHTVRMWDAATGAALKILEGHSGVVWAVAFAPDGKRLASASMDKTIRLWDAATGAAL